MEEELKEIDEDSPRARPAADDVKSSESSSVNSNIFSDYGEQLIDVRE